MKTKSLLKLVFLIAVLISGCHAKDYDSMWGGRVFYSEVPNIFSNDDKAVTRNILLKNNTTCRNETRDYDPIGEKINSTQLPLKQCGPLLVAAQIVKKLGVCTKQEIVTRSEESVFGKNTSILKLSEDCLCYHEVTTHDAIGMTQERIYGHTHECFGFFNPNQLETVNQIISEVISTLTHH